MLDITPVEKLTRDLKASAASLTVPQARFLVDLYYTMQDQRIRSDGQVRALTETEEPHEIIKHFAEQWRTLEKQAAGALEKFSDAHPVGQWMRTVKGIGPVLSAGLLAHIDIRKAPVAGSIWRFGGHDPSIVWNSAEFVRGVVTATRKETKSDWLSLISLCDQFNRKPLEVLRTAGHFEETPTASDALEVAQQIAGLKFRPKAALHADNVLRELLPREKLDEAYEELLGEFKFDWREITATLTKRPWNADLKVLLWKVGESFVKVSSDKGEREPGYYGLVWKHRKEYEIENNEAGRLAHRAKEALERKKFRADTIAKRAYESGKLPDAHIHRRATRYAVKLFVAHLHEKLYEHEFGRKPPLPYVIAHQGHGHYIPPPEAAA